MGPSCVTWFKAGVVWPLFIMVIGVVVCSFRLRVFSFIGGRYSWL